MSATANGRSPRFPYSFIGMWLSMTNICRLRAMLKKPGVLFLQLLFTNAKTCQQRFGCPNPDQLFGVHYHLGRFGLAHSWPVERQSILTSSYWQTHHVSWNDSAKHIQMLIQTRRIQKGLHCPRRLQLFGFQLLQHDGDSSGLLSSACWFLCNNSTHRFHFLEVLLDPLTPT